MARAPKLCSGDGGRCTNVQPCPVHTRDPWATSRRDTHVKLSGSAQQRRARRILERYGYVCHVCGEAGADQADHVVALSEGGADEDYNMRPIHARPCHVEKTAAESARARDRG